MILPTSCKLLKTLANILLLRGYTRLSLIGAVVNHRCGMSQRVLLQKRVVIHSKKDTAYEESIPLEQLKLNI